MKKARRILLLVFGVAGAFSVQETTRRSSAAPAGGRFVQAEGVEVYIQEEGPPDGPPVLLVHGAGAWSELWRETLDFLAGAGYRAIAIDVPPFGFSGKPRGAKAYQRGREAQRLEAVLDALNVHRAALVAHSVGSRSVAELALRAPDRVRSLVLIDPALGFAPKREDDSPSFEQNHPSLPLRAFLCAGRGRDVVLSATVTNPQLTRTIFTKFVSRPEAITAERVAVLQRPLSVQGSTRAYGDWLRNLMLSKDYSLSSRLENLGTLAMPVHLIWGDCDTITPLWQGRALHAAIAGSTFDVIPGAGHIPYIEAPSSFQRSLGAFLATH